MSEREIGIEEARKQLGPLADAARDGDTIYLTSHRRRVAAIVPLSQVTPKTRHGRTRHRPEDHTDTCFCGQSATVHIDWGSGCGNVCQDDADKIKFRNPSAHIEEPIGV